MIVEAQLAEKTEHGAAHRDGRRLRVLHLAHGWSYWGRLSPTCLESSRTQIAGGETATLRAAFETAARGHDVHVVTLCTPGKHRGVTFHDNPSLYEVALDRGPWDAVVVWGEPTVFAELSKAWEHAQDPVPLRICAQQCNGFIHRDALQGFVDRYVSPSGTHADMLSGVYGVPRDRFWVIYNGVEPSRYRLLGQPRDPFAVYHASSPDRGLHHLLEAWPEIHAAEPRATLDVYYEYKKFISLPAHHAIMDDLILRLRDAMFRVAHGHGVTFHGGQPQQVVADRACTAGVMCYPCDPVAFTEGFGTSVLEAYVTGCVPVVSDADAFGEVYGGLFPLIPRLTIREQLVEAVLAGIATARKDKEAGRAGHAFATVAEGRALMERYSWKGIGGRWARLCEEAIAARERKAVAA